MIKKLSITYLFIFIGISAFANKNPRLLGKNKFNSGSRSAFGFINLKQAGPITGTVKDSTGMVLVGVNISIKGTKTGTQSNVDGKFTLSANPGDILVFTYIGYATKEVTVGTA